MSWCCMIRTSWLFVKKTANSQTQAPSFLLCFCRSGYASRVHFHLVWICLNEVLRQFSRKSWKIWGSQPPPRDWASPIDPSTLSMCPLTRCMGHVPVNWQAKIQFLKPTSSNGHKRQITSQRAGLVLQNQLELYTTSSLWFQPIRKNMSQIGSFPQFSGWTLKKMSCHHSVFLYDQFHGSTKMQITSRFKPWINGPRFW